MARRIAIRVVAAAFALGVALPATAQESPFVSIAAVRADAGWFFEVDLDGPAGTIPSATLTPPTGPPAAALACRSDGEEDFCSLRDPSEGSAGYASLAALLASHPSGSYFLDIGSGARTVQLGFAPVEPDGNVTVTSPANGAVSVDSTPTILYTHDCDTCGFLFFEIEGFGATAPISLETTRVGSPPFPDTGSVPYAELTALEGPKPAELWDGSYLLRAGAGRGSLETLVFDQGGELQYASGAEYLTTSEFTVPEPGAGLAARASLLSLGGVARARPRARRRLVSAPAAPPRPASRSRSRARSRC